MFNLNTVRQTGGLNNGQENSICQLSDDIDESENY